MAGSAAAAPGCRVAATHATPTATTMATSSHPGPGGRASSAAVAPSSRVGAGGATEPTSHGQSFASCCAMACQKCMWRPSAYLQLNCECMHVLVFVSSTALHVIGVAAFMHTVMMGCCASIAVSVMLLEHDGSALRLAVPPAMHMSRAGLVQPSDWCFCFQRVCFLARWQNPCHRFTLTL